MALIRPPITYPGVYVTEVSAASHALVGVSTSTTVFIGRTEKGPVEEPTTVTSFADVQAEFGASFAFGPTAACLQDFFLHGGSVAVVLRVVHAATGKPSDPLVPADYDRALGLLEKLPAERIVNLLCVPPDRRDGDTAPEVYRRAAEVCAARRAMLIADPPTAWGSTVAPADLTAEHLAEALGDPPAEAARHVAMYFPRVLRPDPLAPANEVAFPPCGAIAGIYARHDSARGVWTAPAGMEAGLVGVSGLGHDLDDDTNGRINQLGINALRSFQATGPVVWGARTARGADTSADDYKYVPVRRLADHIEASIEQGTKWAVFGSNDESTWGGLLTSVESFLADLFRQGAFQGASPKDAYFSQCDASTTTAADVANGIANLVVGFAPFKPAEFVVLYFSVPCGGTP